VTRWILIVALLAGALLGTSLALVSIFDPGVLPVFDFNT